MTFEIVSLTWREGRWRAEVRGTDGEDGWIEGRAHTNYPNGLDPDASMGGSAPLRDAMWEWWCKPETRALLLSQPGAPARPPMGTCADCKHFEPDEHGCERDPIRIVRDGKGKRVELVPRVSPSWSCDSFELYVHGTLPERPYEGGGR